ncbi:MAG: NAD(P)/FAD-dependent oxidoreductase [Alphaproteobacteria bacterium]
MTESLDCVVVGAGAIGLAIARALALAGRDVVVLEAEAGIGTGISARNSEVIHAGIYYPANSLRAQFCVAGRRALYRFCAERSLPHRQVGKLIVATSDDDIATLAHLKRAAEGNGVDDLVPLTGPQALAVEPALTAKAALFSPSTGIIDSHAYMLALQGEAEDHGAALAFETRVDGGRVGESGIEIYVAGAAGGESRAVRAKTLINAAGLGALPLAAGLTGFPQALVPRRFFAKGSYFSLSGQAPFSHLVYPVPVPGGLGVHLTLDLSGRARFGPDVEWIDAIDYVVNPARAEQFYAEIRRYYPALPDGALLPDYAGIRPKITGPGEPAADFVIQGPRDHGVPGLVNLFGIESPGLTASLAIADHVTALIET